MNPKQIIKELSKKLTSPIFCIDIESTGLDVNIAEVVQIAGVRVNTDGTYKKLKFYCKPTIPVEDGAFEVHGISNESLEDKKPFAYYAAEFVELCDGAIITGYNIGRFDLLILDRQLSLAGFPGTFDNSIIYETFDIYRKHSSRKLADAYRYYSNEEMPPDDAHDALNDVVATLKVLDGQITKEARDIEIIAKESYPEPSKRVGLKGEIAFNEANVPVFAFGKHKNKPLASEKNYCKWILSQDFSETVKKYIQDNILN